MEQTKIDGYLFDEMSERERETIEESFLDDDTVFYTIAARENELVDLYVKGELAGDDLTRFEASLDANPARRQKIANGRALREFIADEHAGKKTITIAERSGFFAKLADLFTLRSTALQFTSAGLILLLAAASIFLLIENRRLSSLETELAAARQREVDLSTEIETAQQASGGLEADLSAERQRIRKLEAEIAALQGRGHTNSYAPAPESTTIATLVLSPILRRGQPMKRIDLSPGVERVYIVVELEDELLNGETVTVRVNDNRFQVTASIVKGRITTGIPRSILKQGRNNIEVRHGSDVIAQHDFDVHITK